MKKIILGLAAVAAAASLSACTSGNVNSEKESTTTRTPTTTGHEEGGTTADNAARSRSGAAYTFGDKILYEGLEITFDKNVEWTRVDNVGHVFHNKDTVRIPVTVKNTGEKEFDVKLFAIKFYAPDGKESGAINSLFHTDLSMGSNLKTGESRTTHVHVLYDGNGDYRAELTDVKGERINVTLPISK